MSETTKNKPKESVSTSKQTQPPRNKGGRPPKLTPEQREEVYIALEDYILRTDDPIIPEFVSENEVALQYNVTRDNLNDWGEFSTLIKRAVTKQESYLIKKGGAGKYNPTIAIFRLKQPQHGYKDKFETDITSDGERIGLSAEQADQLIRARAKRSKADI